MTMKVTNDLRSFTCAVALLSCAVCACVCS